jgi:hypothetical protein
MPSLLEILKDPNYVNANEATKEAIFNKYSVQDKNYADANDATKEAIRTKFGVGVPADIVEPEPSKDTGIFSMAGRAVARGAKQTGSLLGDVLPAMAASAVGADEYAARQMAEAAETQKEIDQWNELNISLTSLLSQQQENIRQGKYSIELAKQINEIQAQVNIKAETIAQTYPEVAELFETKPTDIAQLRQNIAPDTLVIQAVPLRDKIALFLFTKDKLTVIESNIKADEFNQLVNTYRNQISDRKNADYLDTSSQLYEILIRPIEQQIKSNSPKNLAIIATNRLRYIPFESLYDSKTEQYLLQKYPISYLGFAE